HDYLRGSAGKGLRGLGLRWVLHYLRLWDSRTPHGVDLFIANSNFVARRIHKTYGRQADVIYPPIDIDRFSTRERKDNFFLSAGRLMPYKRVGLIVDAFRQMPQEKLIVIGDGPELRRLRKK